MRTLPSVAALASLTISLTIGLSCDDAGQVPDSVAETTQALNEPGTGWEPDDEELIVCPPVIPPPVYACSLAVLVEGCLTNAEVQVFDNASLLLGSSKCGRQARAHVALSRALIEGENIYARQTMNQVVSEPSPYLTVEHLTDGIAKPRVQYAWECGERIAASVLTPGLLTEAQIDGSYAIIGTANPTKNYINASGRYGEWYWPIHHNSTPQGTTASVRVRQIYCPGMPHEVHGPYSDWFAVESFRERLPALRISYKVGTEEFSVRDALVGAAVDFDVAGSTWRDWAWTTDMLVESPVLKTHTHLSASQSLCPGMEPVPPILEMIPEEEFEEWLLAPTIATPICPGSRYVTIQTAVNGGYVHVFHNGARAATVGGSEEPVGADVGWSSSEGLREGDEISAYQRVHGTNGNLISPLGYALVDRSEPSFTVIGQSTSTDWNTGEPREGFPRQTSRGPTFVLECCADCHWEYMLEFGHCLDANGERRKATVEIDGGLATVTLVEESHGRFVGRWDWLVPDEGNPDWPPPEGEYEVYVIDSPCDDDLGPQVFLVYDEQPHPCTGVICDSPPSMCGSNHEILQSGELGECRLEEGTAVCDYVAPKPEEVISQCGENDQLCRQTGDQAECVDRCLQANHADPAASLIHSIHPLPGTTMVPPDLAEMVITFTRPIDPASFSLVDEDSGDIWTLRTRVDGSVVQIPNTTLFPSYSWASSGAHSTCSGSNDLLILQVDSSHLGAGDSLLIQILGADITEIYGNPPAGPITSILECPAGEPALCLEGGVHWWEYQFVSSDPPILPAVALAFSTEPQAVVAGTCSVALVVEAQDDLGDRVMVTEAAGVALSSDSAMVFFEDAGCLNAVTEVTIAVGESDTSFYFVDTTAGEPTITAADTATEGSVLTGAEQTQVIVPGPSSGGTTLLWAADSQLPADGSSTTTIFVAAHDAFGNSRGQGGDVVALQTTAGSLGAATDHGDGTFTATLTSSTVAGESATVSGTINGQMIGGSAVVDFVAAEPAVLVPVSGDGQTALPSADLDPLVVQVRDQHGNGVSGVQVDWSSLNGGAIAPTSSLTSGEGRASATATLGSSPGSYGFTATIQGTALVAIFQATASGPPAELLMLGGQGQTGAAGSMLTEPMSVKVVDAFGNPVGGAQVDWSASGDGAAVSDVATTTASDGTTSSTATLGPIDGASYEYTASLNGTALAQTFTAFCWSQPDEETPTGWTNDDLAEMADQGPAGGIDTGFPEGDLPMDGALLWRMRFELTISIVSLGQDLRWTLTGPLSASWGLHLTPYWLFTPSHLPGHTAVALPMRLAKEQAGEAFSTFGPIEDDTTSCGWTEGGCKVVVDSLQEHHPYGQPGDTLWPVHLYYDAAGNRYLGTLVLSSWARPQSSARQKFCPSDPNHPRAPEFEDPFDWREGMENPFRDPGLPCVNVDGTPEIPIAFAIDAALIHTSDPATIPIENLALHDRGCDGVRASSSHYINVTGNIYLDPIHITHPEEVREGTHRTTESQFVYDANDPGNLRLERNVVAPDPRPTIRGYVMQAPADPVLTEFLEENVMWTTPRLEECGSSDVSIAWESCDVWDENLSSSQPTCNPNYQPTQGHEHFGMGLQAEVIYQGLPSCNAGFGRKLAMAQVRDPEFNSSRHPIAGAFKIAGHVNYEVFFDKTATNHPGGDQTCPSFYLNVIPNHQDCPEGPGVRIPNAFYYYLQTAPPESTAWWMPTQLCHPTGCAGWWLTTPSPDEVFETYIQIWWRSTELDRTDLHCLADHENRHERFFVAEMWQSQTGYALYRTTTECPTNDWRDCDGSWAPWPWLVQQQLEGVAACLDIDPDDWIPGRRCWRDRSDAFADGLNAACIQANHQHLTPRDWGDPGPNRPGWSPADCCTCEPCANGGEEEE